MRIDHRAFVHVSSHVNKHGRHADHTRRDIRASAHRRSARHNAYSISHSKSAHREGIFVYKRKADVFAHLAEFAQTKAKQNALLHPDVYDPLSINFFRGTNLALA